MLRPALTCTLLLLLTACESGLRRAVDPPGETASEFNTCLDTQAAQYGWVSEDGSAFAATVLGQLSNGQGVIYEQDGLAPAAGMPPALHIYLDCYIAPVAPNDLEGRALRGHVLLVFLAQYGAFVIESEDFTDRGRAAEQLLAHIRDASLSLTLASDLTLKAMLPGRHEEVDRVRNRQRYLADFYHVRRVVKMFQLAIDIEEINLDNNVRQFSHLASAIASGPAGAALAKDLLDRALDGLARGATFELFGAAFREGAKRTLSTDPRINPDGPTIEHWQVWDERLLAACSSLANIAALDGFRCIPTRREVIEALGLDESPGRREV